jgi:hypothetical protein
MSTRNVCRIIIDRSTERLRISADSSEWMQPFDGLGQPTEQAGPRTILSAPR